MKKLVWLIIVIIIVVAAWYLGSPLFIDKEVDEAFPEDTPTSINVIPTPEELAEMTEEQLEVIKDETMEKAAMMPDKVMTETMPDVPEVTGEPTLLKSGNFRDADDFHRGSGTAGIYELSDGSRILRFEDFDVVNGPDLRVFLVPHPDPRDRGDVQSGNYVEVARLKGNKGDQNYELPNSYSVEDAGSVVIYCKPFHVLFSVATLE